ncbi:MAG TPA: FeoA domain-containing protein [Gemmataceae bacterium]|nr:FeoA domain-containing protein [Gemmataceae bacterium]
MPVETLLPLELLESGECAEIAEVYGEPGWVHRLVELGVRIGCRLRVLQGGSPCLVQIGGLRLSLRNDGPTKIMVLPLGIGEAVA